MIKWATKTDVVGKLPKSEGHRLGKGWTNLETTLIEMFEMVALHGAPIAPYIKTENNAAMSKNIKTFASHDVVFIDIDDGMTIEQLEAHEFYQAYGTGYYVSPSHSDKLHKFRIIFALEETVDDSEVMRALYTGIISKFGGDEACKDASRLFFGTVNAVRSDLRPDKMLPDSKIIEIVKNEIRKIPVQFEHAVAYEPTGKIDIDRLEPVFAGGRDIFVNAQAWRMMKENVPLAQAIENIRFIAQTKCIPPFDVNEAVAKVKYKYNNRR